VELDMLILLIGVLTINIGIGLLVAGAFAASRDAQTAQRSIGTPGEAVEKSKARRWFVSSGITGTATGVLMVIMAVAGAEA
jgi:hypothetical protein